MKVIEFCDEKGKKIIFDLNGKKIFLMTEEKEKKVIRNAKSNHYLGKYGGFAFNEEIIDYLVRKGYLKIEILYNGRSYNSEIKDWVEKGVKDNFGYGNQIVLSSKFMTIKESLEEKIRRAGKEIIEGVKNVNSVFNVSKSLSGV